MFVINMRTPPRCAYCHEALGSGATCVACHTALHDECRAELGRCPSLGCRCTIFARFGALLSQLAPSAMTIRAFIQQVELRAAVIGILVGLLCLFVTGFAAVSAGTEGYSKYGFLIPANPEAAEAWVVVGIAATGVTAYVQISYVRNVRRLLLETRSRRVRLRVESEKQQVKGGTITVFKGYVRENGRRTLTLSLGQDPAWLGPWFIESEISLYGGRFLEPVILNDGEKLHVVRNVCVWRS